jgi:hypothetical protein
MLIIFTVLISCIYICKRRSSGNITPKYATSNFKTKANRRTNAAGAFSEFPSFV